MIGERKPMSIRSEVLRLHSLGRGKKKIAAALGISPTTVRGIVRGSSSETPGDSSTLEPKPTNWSDGVPWNVVEEQLHRPYATIKQLAKDFAPEDVSYLKFWRTLQKKVSIDLSAQARIRFHYKPGERFEMDYCDGFLIHDKETGKTKKTHLFVCVSVASDYTFGEFSMSQKTVDFLGVQDRCFSFFGGVPDAVIIDNLKAGVKTAHRYDPEHNPTYFDYAKHMGFIVLPARPRTPRDKPTVEATIGVIQRQFFAENRDVIFYSIRELNQKFRIYLKNFNAGEMKDYGISRLARFENEKSALKSLPVNSFEVVQYKTAKVHTDCHVQIINNFYSIPYRLIGQSVRVKIADRMIEVYNSDYELIARHARMRGRGEFSTDESHYPENKIVSNRLDILSLKREAESGGPAMIGVVATLLESPHPLRYLRRIQGIIRLKKSYSKQSIEYACSQALTFKRFNYQFIECLAKRHTLQGGRMISSSSVPVRDLSEVHLRVVLTEEENGLKNE